ncbi:unnamed protein product [Ilex paraguariensis]|uniref:Uncharacterized protein n=1 Tax=Ilex paraguariensis TaxID=185542 RepID=A0ABC8SVB0_9AQUA
MKMFKRNKDIIPVKITHFPVTLSEAPCLKCGEEELSSSRETRAPELIVDDAIGAPITSRKDRDYNSPANYKMQQSKKEQEGYIQKTAANLLQVHAINNYLVAAVQKGRAPAIHCPTLFPTHT